MSFIFVLNSFIIFLIDMYKLKLLVQYINFLLDNINEYH